MQLTRLLHEAGGYRTFVACLDGTGPLRGEVERLGLGRIPEYPLTSFYDRNALVQVRRFAEYLRQNRIEVLHTHDFYTNVFGMAAGALARVPVRIASRRETFGYRSETQKRVERVAYRLADAVVVNAEAVGRQLISEGVPAKKIQTVYNGMDAERITPRPGRSREELLASFDLPQNGGRRFVTIVANLRHPVKDHPTFLRAARRVRGVVPEAAFVLAGEGELTESLRGLAAELKLDGDAFFTGRCERVGDLLAVSDVCVLSSTAEGFSNSILEYMAAARPVVATDVGGAREAVAEGVTGYLVEAGNDEAMAARILLLLKDPAAARRMGGRGRQVVLEKFSCAAQLERTGALYERLLTRPRAALPRVGEEARA